MSAIEAVYNQLVDDNERAMWRRALSVAHDDDRTELERALAMDVTALLVSIGMARKVLHVTTPPSDGPPGPGEHSDG